MHTCSMSTFEPPELMKLHNVYQIYSKYAYKMMALKIWTQGGTKLDLQQVKYLRKWSWRVYTSQNCRILFSFRLYWLCMNKRKFETTNSRAIPDCRHQQDVRTRSFRSRNEIIERGAVTKRQKGKKAIAERKVGECYQWKAIGQCSKGDSRSFRHDPASGNRRDQGQKGQSSSPAPKAKAPTDGKLPSKKFRPQRGKSQEAGFPCRNVLRGECTYPSCNFWHPPVCLDYKSESGCT